MARVPWTEFLLRCLFCCAYGFSYSLNIRNVEYYWYPLWNHVLLEIIPPKRPDLVVAPQLLLWIDLDAPGDDEPEAESSVPTEEENEQQFDDDDDGDQNEVGDISFHSMHTIPASRRRNEQITDLAIVHRFKEATKLRREKIQRKLLTNVQLAQSSLTTYPSANSNVLQILSCPNTPLNCLFSEISLSSTLTTRPPNTLPKETFCPGSTQHPSSSHNTLLKPHAQDTPPALRGGIGEHGYVCRGFQTGARCSLVRALVIEYVADEIQDGDADVDDTDGPSQRCTERNEEEDKTTEEKAQRSVQPVKRYWRMCYASREFRKAATCSGAATASPAQRRELQQGSRRDSAQSPLIHTVIVSGLYAIVGSTDGTARLGPDEPVAMES
ncbi:hypothetical protein CPB85DRAFT_1251326 [Mucidula mucida]|nr:hypothetical protein CPB85DRAFT_1251326 [Mucidula mucida]